VIDWLCYSFVMGLIIGMRNCYIARAFYTHSRYSVYLIIIMLIIPHPLTSGTSHRTLPHSLITHNNNLLPCRNKSSNTSSVPTSNTSLSTSSSESNSYDTISSTTRTTSTLEHPWAR
jgi:hypothetical protein